VDIEQARKDFDNMNDIKHYTEANRAAWDEVMPKHQTARKERLDRLFAQPGYI
jgi:flagellin-specific chaperone FliS